MSKETNTVDENGAFVEPEEDPLYALGQQDPDPQVKK